MGARFESAELRTLFRLPRLEESRIYTSVSTDTRALEPGALFVALQGERFDGADFLMEAATAGARGAVVPRGRERPDLDMEWFPVDDTTAALGALARRHRTGCAARVVGITGSSGKTTVKEMVALAVAEAFRTHSTSGNFNNRIGLPLSILSAPADAEVWVLELGTSAPGEIARLTDITAPDDAVITTVGPAHLEGFGDLEGVLNEKLDLVRGASPAGLVVVGESPDSLPPAARAIRPDAMVAGLGEGADYRPEGWSLAPHEVVFERSGVACRVPAGGEHHLRDALIASAVAEGMGVAPEAAARGLGRYRPLGMRSSVRQSGALTVVADCYNANPESFAAAISYCEGSFPDRRLAAVVGTMLELGSSTEAAHRTVAQELVDAGFELIVALGEFGPAFCALGSVRNGTTVAYPESAEEAWRALRGGLDGDEVVLVKASRGVQLETVVERLVAEYGEGGA
jgi:UDP-N-acetylmuramoyl-tripeptide--D-alanyl-D-alanine ligase